MRILSLAHTYPYPPDDGSRVRIWNMLVELASSNDVVLLTSGASTDMAPPSPPRLRIESHPPPPPRRAITARVGRLWSAFITRRTPAQVAMTSEPMLDRLGQLCKEGWPDIVVAEENASGGELLVVPEHLPRVWVKHSVGYLDALQVPTQSIPARLHRAIESRLVHRNEARVIDGCSLVVSLTAEDAAELEELYSPRAVAIVPNGVRLPVLSPARPSQPSVAFLGDYSWGANLDAARWFVRDIWPQVRTAVPDAEFRLLGKNLELLGMSSMFGPSIRRIGYVPDLSEALSVVAVGVVPVRKGTGIRCKLLDFFAAGVPSVTTRLGLQGVPAREGVDCLVADDPDDFARHVVTLLRDPVMGADISQSARTLAESLSWVRRAEELQSSLERLVPPV